MCDYLLMPDFKRVTILFDLPQYAAIRDEATRRAVKNGGKADASAVVRELVEQWMRKSKKP